MKWTKLLLASLTLFATFSLHAYDLEEEDFFSLDSEIEALLEDEVFDDETVNAEIGVENYEELEEEMAPTSEAKKSMTIMSNVNQIDVKKEQAEPLSLKVDRILSEEEPMVVTSPSPLQMIQEETKKSIETIEINLRQVFKGSPIIYTVLFFLSTMSVCVWLYSMFTIRSFDFLPPKLVKELRTKLVSNQFDEALDLCVKEKHFFCKMLASGILARRHGLNVMIDTMKAEGKRSTVAFWQRIGILNEIAIIAPMLGLLGTVMGMFYAFYDLNRSVESVSLLFDGLGVSVGTTVAGLIVAILAMILYSVAKYRLVKTLASVENEAQTFATLIDARDPSFSEK